MKTHREPLIVATIFCIALQLVTVQSAVPISIKTSPKAGDQALNPTPVVPKPQIPGRSVNSSEPIVRSKGEVKDLIKIISDRDVVDSTPEGARRDKRHKVLVLEINLKKGGGGHGGYGGYGGGGKGFGGYGGGGGKGFGGYGGGGGAYGGYGGGGGKGFGGYGGGGGKGFGGYGGGGGAYGGYGGGGGKSFGGYGGYGGGGGGGYGGYGGYGR